MKPQHQLEKENELLKRTGMELYERAEKWRKALEEIKKFNTDPIISSIIRRNLNE